MQPWQIKAFKLETSALNHLDGFIHEHTLYFLIGIIGLLLALLAWVWSGALQGKGGKSTLHIPPGIFFGLHRPPSTSDTFDPFPKLRDPGDCDHDEY